MFLNQMMDLGLSAEEITALETRTEGWITGLQLAALLMQGREDIPAFIRAFAGDNRYIVDYLLKKTISSSYNSSLTMSPIVLLNPDVE